MTKEHPYELLVIGGGPAGYAAAIRAGQLGKRVACIELERAGGTCLNWGCIPSKALLKSAEIFVKMKHAEVFGLSCENPSFDFAKVMKRSRNIADQMGKGIEFLFRKNKVDAFKGVGHITVPGVVEIIDGRDCGKILPYQKLLIATGCKSSTLLGLKIDGERVMTSREMLNRTTLPKSIVILGAGAIGVEFAYFLNAFGCKVTLVEMLPHIVPVEDAEISEALEHNFKKQRIVIYTHTKAENINVFEDKVTLDLIKEDQKISIQAESLLLAIGIKANTEGLLSRKISLNRNRGFIQVNDAYQTNIPNIYAAGDIIGPPLLAHVATYEAVQAVNGMFGHSKPNRVGHFPACTYCQPQVASIGLTEEAAQMKNIPYRVGRFPFNASGKAVAINAAEGFVKVITGKKYGEILGAHIIGNDATEMIAEYSLAMTLEATAEDMHTTIHAHPTMSEAMAEAAASVFGEAIHI